MKSKPMRFHYAWIILLCCICLNTSCVGILASCQSQLLGGIVSELNCSLSALSLYLTIMSIVMALLYPMAGRLLSQSNLNVVLTAGALLQIAGVALMAAYRSVYWFYFSGILMGIGGAATMFMATPILINIWFAKRTGFAMGIALSFTGVGAAVFSPIIAACANALGWRAAALIMAGCGALIVLPCTLFLVKRPAQKGVPPYGAGESASNETAQELEGLTRKQALGSPSLYFVILFGLALSMTACVTTLLPTFGTMELGITIELAALGVSCVNITNIICKFLLGYFNDRFGIKFSIVYGVFFLAAGLLGILRSGADVRWLIPSCVVFGLGFGLYNVELPLLTRKVFGLKHYSDIWSLVMMATSLVGAFAIPFMNLIYDRTGSYRGVWHFLLGCCIAAILSGFLALDLKTKKRAKADKLAL